jgi:hypothetical protein
VDGGHEVAIEAPFVFIHDCHAGPSDPCGWIHDSTNTVLSKCKLARDIMAMQQEAFFFTAS